MDLEFKADFDAAREGWTRFWKGEFVERPLVQLTVPRSGCEPVVKPHPYEINEVGVEEYGNRIERWVGAWEFLGEAIPFCQISFGADHLGLLMGADMELSGDVGTGTARTAWMHPFLDDYDTELSLRPDWKWYETTMSAIDTLRRRFEGRLVLSISELAGGLDTLAAIRGTENLLTDLLVCPDAVKGAVERIDALQAEALALCARAMGAERWGCITRHGNYANGLTSVPQCDFSFMTSNAMFREFQIPSLLRECGQYEGAVYHLDGPNCIQHLEAVCEIDKIKVIQWVPGAGAAQSRDWMDLYDRVDGLGRGNYVGGSVDRVLQWAQRWHSPYGCYRAWASSRDEGERFLDDLMRIRR